MGRRWGRWRVRGDGDGDGNGGPGGLASCCAAVPPDEAEQRARSRQIDRSLAAERQRLRRQVRLLLLGAGESGKSTFLKQMRIIHRVQFEPELVRDFRLVIYHNAVRGMQVLVDARDKLAIPWSEPRSIELARLAAEWKAPAPDGRRDRDRLHPGAPHPQPQPQPPPPLDARAFGTIAPHIRALWRDRAIKRAYERRREFQLSDSVSYFFDEIDRIARPDYIPTNQDILHCRKATKGISEFTININNVPFVFVDVGGQRTQRQKWTQCFDSVTSILFLVSSSEFDQVLSEDRVTNRLEEAKIIFDTIVNNISFRGISIILFLNKSDLLAQKVANPETDIRWYYPEYKGDPHSLPEVQKFILEMFANVRREPKTTLYHHFTTAIDTQNIEVVFNSVKDTILNRNLASLMLQ